MSVRTALLINCSRDEAMTMRRWAEIERRTISGHVLNVVMKTVRIGEILSARSPNVERLTRSVSIRTPRPPGARTTVLLRCSGEESRRIRASAQRRDMTISGFILTCLHRTWEAKLAAQKMIRRGIPWDSD
jgi:uncharacterized protein (DUF1778 family)